MQVKVLAGGSALVLMLSLSGCGSDAGVSVNTVAGTVTQGPVKGATIFADRIGSGTRYVNDGELSTKTSSEAGKEGSFSLSVPGNYGDYVLVSQGGTDSITNEPAIQMLAPAGASNVTPLTTLVALDSSLKSKIEATGVKYDANIYTSATPAALLVAQSVESAIKTLTKTLDPQLSKIPAAEMNEIQKKFTQAIAAKLADSATLDATTLTQQIKAAAGGVETILAPYSDITVDTAGALNTALTTAIDTNLTAVAASIGSATSEQSMADQLKTVDATINTNAAAAATTVTVKDTSAPSVVFTSGSADLTGVAINASVTVTFSEPVLGVSSSTFTVKSSAGAVAGTVTYNATTKTATFKPTNPLVNGTVYTVTLTSGITDASEAKNPLAQTTLTFTTVALPVTGSTGTTGTSGTGANF